MHHLKDGNGSLITQRVEIPNSFGAALEKSSSDENYPKEFWSSKARKEKKKIKFKTNKDHGYTTSNDRAVTTTLWQQFPALPAMTELPPRLYGNSRHHQQWQSCHHDSMTTIPGTTSNDRAATTTLYDNNSRHHQQWQSCHHDSMTTIHTCFFWNSYKACMG